MADLVRFLRHVWRLLACAAGPLYALTLSFGIAAVVYLALLTR
ncbi:hypothetical protein [Streptomyces sp. NPDC053560]